MDAASDLALTEAEVQDGRRALDELDTGVARSTAVDVRRQHHLLPRGRRRRRR